MPTMKIKGYDTIINCDWLGDGVYVIIGVEEEGHPEDAHFGTWVDEKIYYFLTAAELDNLKIGDVLNDGEDFTIVDIDKNNPHIWEIDYDEEDVCE